MEKQTQIQKTIYSDFIRAVNGYREEVQKIMEIFQKQRMIVLSNAPGCSELRKEICEVAMQLKENHKQENKCFSVGTTYYNDMVSHMNNCFTVPDALKIASSLGFSEDDSPDLLQKSLNPNIDGYDRMEQRFVTFAKPIFFYFFKIIDLFFQNTQQLNAKSESNNLNQSIQSVAQRTEVQK